MTKHDQLFVNASGRKEESNPLVLRVRNGRNKNRETTADFSFLSSWLGLSAALVVDALAKFMRQYSSTTPLYNVRLVLEFWKKYQYDNGLPLFLCLEGKPLERQISSLRYEFFKNQTELGKSLVTTSDRWSNFLKFLEVLVLCKILSNVRVDSPGLMAPPKRDILLSREKGISVSGITGPKSFNHEGDSYNEELYERISIIHCNEKYIQEYTNRLQIALGTIKSCALGDFRELVAKRIEGKRLLEHACSGVLDALQAKENSSKYTDPITGLHVLDPKAEHPKLLANLLYVVDREMAGVPKVHIGFSSDGSAPIINSGKPHWRFISSYGKNNLLPYLGVMNSCSMVVCLILILIEHPNINASSLIRAKLEGGDGEAILLAPTGEAKEAETRITVSKPRAGEEKSIQLSPLAKEVIEQVLNWTRPVREELKRSGDVETARSLWVGICLNNYNLVAFPHSTAMNSLKLDVHRMRGEKANKSRITPFLDRHPQLADWAPKITFKSLRVNSGVLRYLETDGDLVATARVFGHKNIETTIGNYIPKPLRLAMYERQIRRHQNKMIVSSLDDESMMLKFSDFETLEELHAFLSSQPTTDINFEEDVEDIGPEMLPIDYGGKERIVIYEDVDAMALAMLYRIHLESAPVHYIDTPDKLTGLAPRFWILFVDALLEPLPLALGSIKAFVEKAKIRMEVIKNKVTFPGYGS